jgi:hypothetical protein
MVARGPKLTSEIRQPHSRITVGVRQARGLAAAVKVIEISGAVCATRGKNGAAP